MFTTAFRSMTLLVTSLHLHSCASSSESDPPMTTESVVTTGLVATDEPSPERAPPLTSEPASPPRPAAAVEPPLPPIHEAAKNGDLEAVRKLLREGNSVVAGDSAGWTPLHHAARSGQEAMMALLIEEGTRIDARDYRGYTPILTAATFGQAGAVRWLIRRGAQVNIDCELGLAPIHLACMFDRHEVLRALLSLNADPSARMSFKKNLGPPWVHLQGCRPVHLAAFIGSVTIAKLLIEAGVEIDAQSDAGFTALHGAAVRAHGDMVDFLLEHGAKVDARNQIQRTPLHAAASSSQTAEEIADLDVQLKKEFGYGLAAVQATPVVARLFRTGKDQLRIMKALLARRADINARDADGWTPLAVAAAACEEGQVVDYLLREGAELETRDSEGFTPLCCAAEKGRLAPLEVLLRYHASVGVRTRLGKTTLHLAAFSGSAPVVDLLLKTGIEVDARDGSGSTALHHAAIAGSEEKVRLLVQAGADPTAKGALNLTPAGWAERMGRLQVAGLLRELEVKGAQVPGLPNGHHYRIESHELGGVELFNSRPLSSPDGCHAAVVVASARHTVVVHDG